MTTRFSKTYALMAWECHEANKRWWQDPRTGDPIKRNLNELLMLCVSELAEAMEGDRKGLADDKLPHRPMREVELVDFLIRVGDLLGSGVFNLGEQWWRMYGGFPSPAQGFADLAVQGPDGFNFAEELLTIVRLTVGTGDRPRMLIAAMNRVWGLGEHLGMDLAGAYEEKMAYNKQREDHTHAARLAVGGKKY